MASKEDVDAIRVLIENLTSDFAKQTDRLSALETSAAAKNVWTPSGIGATTAAVGDQGGEPEAAESGPSMSDYSGDIAKLQEEYRALKDSLQKVKLPADLKLNSSKEGLVALG